MRTTKIQRERQTIEAQINELNAKLQLLRETCKHKKAIKVAHGDTGNWCKADDSYWYSFDCPECGKHWDELQ
jgi:hypothetical protein